MKLKIPKRLQSEYKDANADNWFPSLVLVNVPATDGCEAPVCILSHLIFFFSQVFLQDEIYDALTFPII